MVPSKTSLRTLITIFRSSFKIMISIFALTRGGSDSKSRLIACQTIIFSHVTGFTSLITLSFLIFFIQKEMTSFQIYTIGSKHIGIQTLNTLSSIITFFALYSIAKHTFIRFVSIVPFLTYTIRRISI